jgi:hypothetical protein
MDSRKLEQFHNLDCSQKMATVTKCRKMDATDLSGEGHV